MFCVDVNNKNIFTQNRQYANLNHFLWMIFKSTICVPHID